MNREIEFRCWYYNQMHKVSNIDFRHNQINLFASDTIPIENGILMQYTGLKDKNGKKIFEGDIVKVHFTYEDLMEEYEKDVDIQGVVSLNTALGIYIDTGDEMENYLSEYLCNKNLLEYPEHIEVIGNIYENNLESECN